MHSGPAGTGSSPVIDDSVEYLRQTLADVLRAGVQRVAIGEQGGGVVMRVRFASNAPTEHHLAMVVRELEQPGVAARGESYVQTERHVAADGEVVTVIRGRAGRLYAFVVQEDSAGEIVMTGMPLEETATVG